jgi:hypothetical protein
MEWLGGLLQDVVVVGAIGWIVARALRRVFHTVGERLDRAAEPESGGPDDAAWFPERAARHESPRQTEPPPPPTGATPQPANTPSAGEPERSARPAGMAEDARPVAARRPIVRRLGPASAREAVILSEVLGRPVSRRRTP